MSNYPFKCSCGECAWVSVDNKYYCRRCYLKLRGREIWLEFEERKDGKEKIQKIVLVKLNLEYKRRLKN